MLWFVLGILVTLGGLALFGWLRRNDLRPKWYAWVLFAIGLLNALFIIEASVGSLREDEAGVIAKLVLVGVIVLGLTWGAAWRLTTGRAPSRSAGA